MEKLKIVLPIFLIAQCILAQAQGEEIDLVPQSVSSQIYVLPQPGTVSAPVIVAPAVVTPVMTTPAELAEINLTIENNTNWDIDMVSFDHSNINANDVRLLQNRTLYAHTSSHFLVGRTGYPANLLIGFAVSSKENQTVNKTLGQWEYIEYEHLADTCHNYGGVTEHQTSISYVPDQAPGYSGYGYSPYYYSPYANYAPIGAYAYPPELNYSAVPVYTTSKPFSIRCSGDNSIKMPVVELILEHI